MNISEAVRILEENRPSVIWEDEETQQRKERLSRAIDTVMEHFKPAEIEIEGGGRSWWHVCEDCHGAVDTSDLYCKHCGKPLKK